jgi:hypothetical protein
MINSPFNKLRVIDSFYIELLFLSFVSGLLENIPDLIGSFASRIPCFKELRRTIATNSCNDRIGNLCALTNRGHAVYESTIRRIVKGLVERQRKDC